MTRPDRLHDELDALLDGRPVELTQDLAPLVEAADVLRAELATYELDPEAADRHLEQVLQGSATVVPLPVRPQPSGWEIRRRVVAVALAAALVLAPATMASAAALPGQAMYPFKLAIEQLRLTSVQWSPAREAGERTRLAGERLVELNRLVDLEMFGQVPPAIRALNRAVVAAHLAVMEAAEEGTGSSAVASLKGKLEAVKVAREFELVGLVHKLPPTMTGKTYTAIVAAVKLQPPLTAPERPVAGAPANTVPPATTPSRPGATTPSGGPNTTGTQPPPSSTEPPPPPTTEPPATTTTEPPSTTTTEPPPSSSPDATTAGSGGTTEGTTGAVHPPAWQDPARDELGDQVPPTSIGPP
jgi:hypothetical protein